LNDDHSAYGDAQVLRHHKLGVNQVRFSPQGTMLATAASDGTAIVWDLSVKLNVGKTKCP
jgi:WD40 repeat protein